MSFRIIKIALFIIILCPFVKITKAQQPSHFMLGQEELAGKKIYSILQDKDQDYWLATNDGIIKFDGYSFKKINCKESLTSSFFHLKMDHENTVHVMNYSGQFFQIKNDSCSLRIQIPDSLMYSYIHYSFDKKNNMVITTNCLFKVNADNQIKFYENTKTKGSHYSEPFILKDSSILIHSFAPHKLLTLRKNSTNPKYLNNNPFVIESFYLKNQHYYFDEISGKLLNDNDSTFTIKKNTAFITDNEYLKYYSDNTNLWMVCKVGGIKVFDDNFRPLFNNNKLFQNNFISSFCKDHEGNIILGTFGDGLIVITHLDFTKFNLPEPNSKITKITSTSDNTIFLGTHTGKIYKLDATQNITLFRDKKIKGIEVLEYFEEINELLINEKKISFINLATGKTSEEYFAPIKDITPMEDNKYLISISTGVIRFSPELLHTNDLAYNYLTPFKGRANSIGYDPNTKTIYVGTASGLKIGDEKSASTFSINGQPISCKEVLYFENRVYITTKNNGILVFENNQLADNWLDSRFYSNNTDILKGYQGNLYLSTNSGILIINKKGEVINTLNKSEGLHSNNIVDFEITNGTLWVAHAKGIQPIDIKSIKPLRFSPQISLNQLLVNDSSIDILNENEFNHLQNRFQFTVSTKSIRFRDEINYHYQLEGLNEKWQVNNYFNNKFEYKSLPPGNYIFKVKTVLKNNESPIFSYPFTIKSPLWERWWFYASLSLLFIIITFLLFKRQLKKQRKKIKLQNELNASKLIAIQSQMNPHFIFNAINSIQDLILKEDTDNSYDYVIKFSKLVRQTLSFSDKEFIDIEDEIELLTNYLDLEKLRFKDDLEYSINVNDIKNLQIPPMLIQPFVENALKHGLFHKEGLKKIGILFKLDKTLSCVISDNGIGRKKALEMKNRQQSSHQSFSTSATEKRFKIMEAHYQKQLQINYIDLTKGNKSLGTQVSISIPFKVNY